MRYVLGFYEVDREYGGPEEGGWWYDSGRLIRVLRVEKNAERAHRLAFRATRLLRHLQRGRRQVSSVLYDGGRVECRAFRGTAPAWYPEERPHYE
jgi:hypothetical protein